MAEAIEHNISEQVDSTPRECSREKTPAVKAFAHVQSQMTF